MGVHKKVNGSGYKDGGIIHLYRGFKLLKSEAYTRRELRQNIITRWKRDIKPLTVTEPYYLVIEPNLRP